VSECDAMRCQQQATGASRVVTHRYVRSVSDGFFGLRSLSTRSGFFSGWVFLLTVVLLVSAFGFGSCLFACNRGGSLLFLVVVCNLLARRLLDCEEKKVSGDARDDGHEPFCFCVAVFLYVQALRWLVSRSVYSRVGPTPTNISASPTDARRNSTRNLRGQVSFEGPTMSTRRPDVPSAGCNGIPALPLQPQHANLRQSEVRNTMMGNRYQVRKSDANKVSLLNITTENVAPSIENRKNSVGWKPF